MPRRVLLEPHPTDDLEARYRAGRDPLGRSHWRVLWLLAWGMTAAAVAGVTGSSVRWIGQIVRRAQGTHSRHASSPASHRRQRG